MKSEQRPQILGPDDLAVLAITALADDIETEKMIIFALNVRNRLIAQKVLSKGNDRATIVDPKMIFRWALTLEDVPVAIIMAHNHPSGETEPSPEDKMITQRVYDAGRLVGITLLDSLIIAGIQWSSGAQEGWLPQSPGYGKAYGMTAD